MSSGYGANPFMQTIQMSKSGGASFGSLNVDEDALNVTSDDVDELLTALEASTHDNAFLKSNDDDFVKQMLEGEEMEGDAPSFLTPRESHVLDDILAGQNSLSSLGGLEPLGLDEIPSDPNLLDGLADDLEFQNNSTKLDNFIHRTHLSDTFMEMGNIDKSEPEQPSVVETVVVREQTAAELYPETAQEMYPQMSQDDTSSATTGKRRRVPRRGSLPTMHLHYENPFEPTPIPATLAPEDEPPTKLAAVPVDANEAFTLPAGAHRRAQRRGSLPTMHLNYSSAGFMADHGHAAVNHQEEQQQQEEQAVDMTPEDLDEDPFAPRKMGRMPRRGSTGSYYSGGSMAFGGSVSGEMPTLGVGDVSATVPENLDPEKMMQRLQDLMSRSVNTQKSLQKWDKDNGLPKSHSQTMVNTSRSRKQLLTGVILPKWDGTPLISEETELGKPKARSKVYKKEGGKMKRRMSAPASSAFF
jgi:hypothetical protein